jgi:cytochrome c oxidase subunit 2
MIPIRLSPLGRLTLALPFVVLTAGAVLAAPEPAPQLPRARAEDAAPRVIDITARRFAFEPADIQVAVGEPVQLRVHSEDGLHGIEIKKLKINKDVPRGGEVVTVDFTATDAGRFPIMCSEYCGEDHNTMQGMLVVVAPGDAPSTDAGHASQGEPK